MCPQKSGLTSLIDLSWPCPDTSEHMWRTWHFIHQLNSCFSILSCILIDFVEVFKSNRYSKFARRVRFNPVFELSGQAGRGGGSALPLNPLENIMRTIGHVPVASFLALLRSVAIWGASPRSSQLDFPHCAIVSGDYKWHLRALACPWPGHVFDVAAAYVPLQQQLEAHSLCLPASTGACFSHPIRWEEELRGPVTGRGREWGRGVNEEDDVPHPRFIREMLRYRALHIWLLFTRFDIGSVEKPVLLHNLTWMLLKDNSDHLFSSSSS